MIATDREELAWAAGFFDGEGATVAAHGPERQDGSRRPSPRIDISQANRKVLDRFRSATGRLGAVRGPYAKGHNKKPIYYFRTEKFECVQAIIAMLWFKLDSVKRAQAVRVLKEAACARTK